MQVLLAIDRWLGRIEMAVSVVLLVAISGVTVCAVFFRYVLSAPIDWGVDLSIVLLVWLTFVATPAVFRANGHIAASSLPAWLPAPWSTLVNLVLAFVTLLCVAVLGQFGMEMAVVQQNQVISTLGISRSVYSLPVVWTAVSVGFCVLVRLMGSSLSRRPAPEG